MKKEERFYERIVLFLLLLAAGGLYLSASQAKVVATGTDMASMDFPKGILIVLVLLCGIKLVGNLVSLTKEKTNEEKNDEKVPLDKRTWMTAVCIVLYAALWNIFGFCLSSFVFFYTEALVLKRDAGKKQAAMISIGVTIFIFVIFGMVFGVDFPEPILDLIMG